MSRCLKCNYELVFLEKRHKYKCAKCSSLFTEEEIKLIEFKKYNKDERARTREKIKKEHREEMKRERLRERLKKRKRRDDPNYAEYYQKKKEERNRRAREYHWEHREEILKRMKERYKATKQNEKRKSRRGGEISQ